MEMLQKSWLPIIKIISGVTMNLVIFSDAFIIIAWCFTDQFIFIMEIGFKPWKIWNAAELACVYNEAFIIFENER